MYIYIYIYVCVVLNTKRTTKQLFEMAIGMARQTWADVFIQITGLFDASNCSK